MSPRATGPEPTPEAIAAWVAEMPPAQGVRLAAALADRRTVGLMARFREDAAHAETRTRSRAEVAAEFGVTVKKLDELINNHNRRVREAAQAGD